MNFQKKHACDKHASSDSYPEQAIYDIIIKSEADWKVSVKEKCRRDEV